MTEIKVWEDSETITTYTKRTNSYGETKWWDASYTAEEIDEEEGLSLTDIRRCYTVVGEEGEE